MYLFGLSTFCFASEKLLKNAQNLPETSPYPSQNRPQTIPKPIPNRPQTEPGPTPDKPRPWAFSPSVTFAYRTYLICLLYDHMIYMIYKLYNFYRLFDL